MANNNLGPGGQLPRIGMPVVPAAEAQQQQPEQQQQQQQQHQHHQQHQQLSAAAAAAAVGAAQQAAVEAIRRQEASTRAAAAAAVAVAANENAMLSSLSHHHHHQQQQNWFASQATAAAIARHQHQQQQTVQATAVKAHAYAHAQAVAAAAAAAAAEAAQKKTTASNQPLGDRDPEGIGVMGVIPIGFFRDPQGNAWAASLQHPSHAPRRRLPQNAADESPLAVGMSQAALRFVAQQHMADQQQQLTQNSGREQQNEVIDLQSDEDEEDREAEEPTKRPGFATKPNLGLGALKVPPAQNPSLSMKQKAKEQHTKAHLQELRNANSDRRPGASMPSPRIAAALRDGSLTQILQAPTESHFQPLSQKPPLSQPFVTKRPAPSLLAPVDPTKFRQHHLQQAQIRKAEDAPQAKRRKSDTGSTKGGANVNAIANTAHLNVNRNKPTTPEAPTPEVMNERHTHALRQVILSDKTSNLVLHYGPCVHKWLGAGLTEEEADTAVKAFVDSILMAATGYTHETIPPSLPFPPSEINLDIRQLEELAQEFVAEKNSAIGEAVRCAFTEMKSSHDDAVVNRKHYYDEVKRLDKEIGSLKTKHKREMNDIRVQNDKMVESLNQRIKELEVQLHSVKEETGTSTVAQTKSLETMMKASILTLRMIRRAERNKEQ